ncbi:MAG TPA: hypothetical protein VN903_35990 [Polyangia bacterium]|nr:hypothetical protein [Polyangia bacterium]
MNKQRGSKIARELGRRGGLKGGRARADQLSKEQRSEIARRAAAARWGSTSKSTTYPTPAPGHDVHGEVARPRARVSITLVSITAGVATLEVCESGYDSFRELLGIGDRLLLNDGLPRVMTKS